MKRLAYLLLILLPGSVMGQYFDEPDALEGKTIIQPPEPSSQGGAQLVYPLRLPPGREGMEPALTIAYNSEDPQTWLGTGWDLPLPTIEIDTRWGVPRYDPNVETETYLYEGEQLHPFAHRGEVRSRTTDQMFTPRVEGSFDRIIRHGNSPSNYWWEITAVDGTMFFYGGTPESGPLAEAALLTDAGQIARWALVEVRDRNDNRVTYEYQTVKANGGRQLYPQQITYTGHGKEPGRFRVEFKLDSEPRPDVRINARLGLREVTADRLGRVEVYQQDKLVRAFRLEYTEGAFFQSLLTAIVEEGSDGSEFYRHGFSYYNDVQTTPYGPEERWNVSDDNILGPILNPISGINGETSAIGGSASNSFSAGAAATVGFNDFNLVSKDKTGGGTYAYGNSSDNGLIALVDLNGDGRPDKLFRRNDQLLYRPNLGLVEGRGQFGGEVAVSGVDQFSYSRTTSNSFGAEGNPPFSFVGYEYTNSKTSTETYFADINGDGLLDIVKNRQVYFNALNGQGHPTFSLSSAGTPSPLPVEGGGDEGLFEEDPAELEARIDQYPLQDVVRMWRAPFSGVVRVEAPVQWMPASDPVADDYQLDDGVSATIQLNGTELWRQRIEARDGGIYAPTGLGQIEVNAGDQLYFRLQSVFDGAYDRVDWDPQLTYLDLNEPTNNDRQLRWDSYGASQDFVVASDQRVGLPLNGTVRIQGDLTKGLLSDSLRVLIRQRREGDPVFTLDTILPGDFAGDFPVDFPLEVATSDELSFCLMAKTQISWTKVQWVPRVTYTSSPDAPVTDQAGDFLYVFCPSVDKRMYNHTWRRPDWQIVTATDTLVLIPEVPDAAWPEDTDLLVTLAVKKPGALLGRTTFSAGQMPDTLLVPVEAGDSLSIAYYAAAYEVGRLIRGATVQRSSRSDSTAQILEVGLLSGIDPDLAIFGPLHRGWGQFVYNGNRDRAEMPIDENLLQLDESLTDPPEEISDDPGEIEGGFKPEEADFLMMLADAKNNRWLGYDELTYVQPNGQSASRFGKDDILPFIPEPVGGGALRPTRESKTNEHSVAGGIGVSVATGTASRTTTTSEITQDIMDLNGDRFPDVIKGNNVTYSQPTGLLKSSSERPGFSKHHEAESVAVGFTLGGSYVPSRTSNSGEPKSGGSNRRASRSKRRSAKSGDNSRSAGDTAGESVGISGNFSEDEDEALESWSDINGDGLPDKVYRGGDVSLNYGYRFGPREAWGFGAIQKGVSTDGGGGLGFSIYNGSIAGGISLTITEFTATESLEDVNADGLPDIVLAGDPVRVRLNTGSSFGPTINWADIGEWESGAAVGESVNAAFTVCVPIVIIGVKVCFNPSTSVGRGVSRTTTTLEDVDGDGYYDLLQSGNDGELRVRRSTIGRTNLLKEVQQPHRGTIALDYRSSDASYELPYTIWLLDRLVVDDGLPDHGRPQQVQTFAYAEPHYDRRERTFYGFGEITKQEYTATEELYRSTVFTYDIRSYFRRGLLLREVTQDAAGTPLRQIRYVYDLLETDLRTPVSTLGEGTANNPATTLLMEREMLLFDDSGTPGLSQRTMYIYDDYGQVTRVIDNGGGHPTEQLDVRFTYHEQEEAYDFSQWATLDVMDATGFLEKQETMLDERGNVVQVAAWIEGDTYALHDFTRDAYGLVTTYEEPANANGERAFKTWVYDSVYHQYPVSSVNHFGFEKAFEYDPATGLLRKVINENGRSFSQELDVYGRPVQQLNPLDSMRGSDWSLQFGYASANEAPHRVLERWDAFLAKAHIRNNFTTARGDFLQQQTEADVADGNANAQHALRILDRTRYDAFGRPAELLATEAIGFRNNAGLHGNTSAVSTMIEYDALDRPIRIEQPDGGVWTIQYSFGESPDGIPVQIGTVIDPEGNQQVLMRDVRGQLRAREQMSDAGPVQAVYRYDGQGSLLAEVDALGMEATYEYDGLGRLIRTDSPVEGTKQYQLDAADNLIAETNDWLQARDAELGWIKYYYTYDQLDRIDFPFHPELQVRYHYGAADADSNRVGRLWLVEDGSGAREFWYDALGQPTKEVRTLILDRVRQPTFVTGYTYDSWGRLLQLTYPDGEVLDYGFDRGGQIRSMAGEKGRNRYEYLGAITYDAYGERTYLTFGNGLEQVQRMDPVTERPSAWSVTGGADQLEASWQFDRLGQLREAMTNLRGDSTETIWQQNYAYDARYQLVAAQMGETKGDATDQFDWLGQYGPVRELLSTQMLRIKDDGEQSDTTSSQENYSYRGDAPYFATQVGDRERDFGPGGYLVSERTEGWTRRIGRDDQGRPQLVLEDGRLYQFTFDAFGTWAITSSEASSGLFVNGIPLGTLDHNKDQFRLRVNPYMTVEEDRFVKHFFLEDERILSKEGTGYFSESLLGSSSRVTAGNLDFSERIILLEGGLKDYLASLGLPPGHPTLVGQGAEASGPLPQPDYGDNPLTQTPPGWPSPRGRPATDGPPGHPVWFEEPASSTNVVPGYGFNDPYDTPEGEWWVYHYDPLGQPVRVSDREGRLRQEQTYDPLGKPLFQSVPLGSAIGYGYTKEPLMTDRGMLLVGDRLYDTSTGQFDAPDGEGEQPYQWASDVLRWADLPNTWLSWLGGQQSHLEGSTIVQDQSVAAAAGAAEEGSGGAPGATYAAVSIAAAPGGEKKKDGSSSDASGEDAGSQPSPRLRLGDSESGNKGAKGLVGNAKLRGFLNQFQREVDDNAKKDGPSPRPQKTAQTRKQKLANRRFQIKPGDWDGIDIPGNRAFTFRPDGTTASPRKRGRRRSNGLRVRFRLPKY
jgi:YD repeat-containing protein